MADSYSALVDLVRDWSNRDSGALPNSIIKSSLRYAADTAYRTLMIPPLEASVYYILASENYQTDGTSNVVVPIDVDSLPSNVALITNDLAVKLPVPSDATEFKHLRVAGTFSLETDDDGIIITDDKVTVETDNGVLTISEPNFGENVVFNEKTDTRTFHDMLADKVSFNYWARQGNNLLLNGDLGIGCVVELHYYRRLPALDARYTITGITDADSDLLVLASTDTSVTDTITIAGVDYIGALLPNWLRDENEKVVLFGALSQCFDFLADEQGQQYNAKFLSEMTQLNQEEKNRTASGGNVQMHYNGRHLI